MKASDARASVVVDAAAVVDVNMIIVGRDADTVGAVVVPRDVGPKGTFLHVNVVIIAGHLHLLVVVIVMVVVVLMLASVQ